MAALQEGVSKRSDVLIADHSLKKLEINLCEDLLKKSNSALSWLNSVNENHSVADKKQMKAFTYDFKSLYDNLDPNLVIEAV